MSLTSQKDDSLLDPLSEEVSRRLSSQLGFEVNRFKLKEFVFSRAKREIFSQHPDWEEEGKLQPGAISRLCKINIIIDLQNIDSAFIQELSDFLSKKPEVVEEVVSPVIFQYKPKEKAIARSIDQKVGPGGMTRLHMAAYEGNLEEVKRLVEIEKANVSIKDNSGMTAWDRANIRDFTEIMSYLSNF